MRIPAVLLVAFAALPVLSQEPVVSKASIWAETVKRGEMRVGHGAVSSRILPIRFKYRPSSFWTAWLNDKVRKDASEDLRYRSRERPSGN
jgi:hypothetical protein